MFEPELDVENDVVAWMALVLDELATVFPFESGEFELPSIAERIVYSRLTPSDPSAYGCAAYGPNMESCGIYCASDCAARARERRRKGDFG